MIASARNWQSPSACVYAIQTHTYIYIYTWRERERERERDDDDDEDLITDSLSSEAVSPIAKQNVNWRKTKKKKENKE